MLRRAIKPKAHLFRDGPATITTVPYFGEKGSGGGIERGDGKSFCERFVNLRLSFRGDTQQVLGHDGCRNDDGGFFFLQLLEEFLGARNHLLLPFVGVATYPPH